MLTKMIKGHTRVVGKTQGYFGLAIRDELINCSVNGPNTPRMVTSWELLPTELEAVNQGANIEIGILGTTPPPMNVWVGPIPEPKGKYAYQDGYRSDYQFLTSAQARVFDGIDRLVQEMADEGISHQTVATWLMASGVEYSKTVKVDGNDG